MPAARLRSPAARHLLVMVASVLVLDALALAAYFLGGVREAGPTVRNAFTAAWTVATLVIVGIGLRRIRQARYGQ